MVGTFTQAGSAGPGTRGQHLVLYDGVCALCNGLVQFLLARDPDGIFRFASLQSPIGQSVIARFGGDPKDLTSFYVVKNYQTTGAKGLTRSRAALFVIGQLDWPWKVLRAAAILPTAILDLVYDAVARTRYRVFGRYDQCLAPRPEFRDRFIE